MTPGPFIPSDEPTAFAVGAVVVWSSGGVQYIGTVTATPTQYGGGPPVYTVTPSAAIGTQSTVLVRAADLSCPPAFTSADSTSGTHGDVIGPFTVTTAATPTAGVTVAAGSSLPTHVTLTDNGNGTATLSGTTATVAGTYTFALQATNASGTVQQPFTLTVSS